MVFLPMGIRNVKQKRVERELDINTAFYLKSPIQTKRSILSRFFKLVHNKSVSWMY